MFRKYPSVYREAESQETMRRPMLKPRVEDAGVGWGQEWGCLSSQLCLGSDSNLDTSQPSKHCEGREKNRHNLHTFYFCTVGMRIPEMVELVVGITDLFNCPGAIGL